MPPPKARQLLALVGNPPGMMSLLDRLAELGTRVDTVTDLREARNVFFAAGGHDLLLLGPEVTPRVAEQVVCALRGLDPCLHTLAFGNRHLTRAALNGVRLVPDFHPTSRAGLGAVLRALALATAGR